MTNINQYEKKIFGSKRAPYETFHDTLSLSHMALQDILCSSFDLFYTIMQTWYDCVSLKCSDSERNDRNGDLWYIGLTRVDHVEDS